MKSFAGDMRSLIADLMELSRDEEVLLERPAPEKLLPPMSPLKALNGQEKPRFQLEEVMKAIEDEMLASPPAAFFAIDWEEFQKHSHEFQDARESIVESSVTGSRFSSLSGPWKPSEVESSPANWLQRAYLGRHEITSNDEEKGLEASAQFRYEIRRRLKDGGDNFMVLILPRLPDYLKSVLKSEKCAVCLQENTTLVGELFVVLQCKLFECEHVVHGHCVLSYNGSLELSTFIRPHSSEWIRVMTDISRIENNTTDPVGENRCSIHVKILHLLCDNTCWSYNSPEPISTSLSESLDREYVTVCINQGAMHPLGISRGAIAFTCSVDNGSYKTWKHIANFDLSTMSEKQGKQCKLMLIDQVTKNSLSILMYIGQMGTIHIESIKYAFSPQREISYASKVGAAINAPPFEPAASKRSADRGILWSYDKPEQPYGKSTLNEFAAMALTQEGSRVIQEKLASPRDPGFNLIFQGLKSASAELMMDGFGHFALHKALEKSSDEQKLEFLQILSPRMKDVCLHRQGSFSLQSFMDLISQPKQIRALADALASDIDLIIPSQTGHYVVIKFLNLFGYPDSEFIFESVERHTNEFSMEHYGLQVIKALLQVTPATKLFGIYTNVVNDAQRMVENQFGNYVIQELVERAPTDIVETLFTKLQGRYVRLAKQKFSSNVVEKCLQRASTGWRGTILRELGSSAGKLIRDRYGNYVLQTGLTLASDQQALRLVHDLEPHLGVLRENVKSKWEGILKAAVKRSSKA